MRALPAPAVASSRHKSDWDEPDSVGPDRPPSPVPAAPPARSLPSVLRQFCVSFCSSSSAPSVATERLRIQLVNRSQIRAPLHTGNALNGTISLNNIDASIDVLSSSSNHSTKAQFINTEVLMQKQFEAIKWILPNFIT